jgi:hypothetical protein
VRSPDDTPKAGAPGVREPLSWGKLDMEKPPIGITSGGPVVLGLRRAPQAKSSSGGAPELPSTFELPSGLRLAGQAVMTCLRRLNMSASPPRPENRSTSPTGR